jgi:glycosyltransferase involved in cell wall biosynthesis
MSDIISVIVPVYNNQPTLDETCRQIMEVHERGFGELQLEIIFVNDGSSDKSWDELLRLRGLHKERISLINLSRNFGQAGALFAGFNNASGDAVICVSADLQDPISLMAKMVACWKHGTEIVVCYRENRKDGFLPRKFSNLAYGLARTSYPELPKGGFDYWLMSRRVCRMLCSFKGRHNFVQGYLLSLGFSKAFIPYTRMKRPTGKSGYSFGQKFKIVIDFLVDSSLPIRIMSLTGLFCSMGGVAYSLLITYAWFMHQTPFSGWAPLMVITMMIGGMIMIMLGVIGEYIWRIYDNLKDFPLYIIETTSMARPNDPE